MKNKKLCIISPIEGAYSETFIKNHIDYIDINKIIIYGTDLSSFRYNGKYLFNLKWFNRIILSVYKRLFFLNEITLYENKILKLFIKEKISVVMAEYGPTGVIVSDICKKNNIPLIVHFHGYDISQKVLLESIKTDYQKMFQNCQAIIAVSQNMIKRLIDSGADELKIKYIPYGVNVSNFKPSLIKNHLNFLSVGRFVEKKAPHISILAFYEVYKIFPDIKLTMVGDGPLLDSCKQLVKALNISSSISFLGIKNSKDISKLMSTAFCFIQHSVIAPDGNAEGTPLSILEAAASSLPIVSTFHEGIQDVIINDYSGLLVKEYDYLEMSKAMISLIEDNSLCSRLGRNARETIITKYDLKKQIKKLEDIIILNAK